MNHVEAAKFLTDYVARSRWAGTRRWGEFAPDGVESAFEDIAKRFQAVASACALLTQADATFLQKWSRLLREQFRPLVDDSDVAVDARQSARDRLQEADRFDEIAVLIRERP